MKNNMFYWGGINVKNFGDALNIDINVTHLSEIDSSNIGNNLIKDLEYEPVIKKLIDNCPMLLDKQ